MAVAKVEEITCASPTSFGDAIQKGIDRACRTLDQVEGAWIQEQKIVIRNQKVAEYRVNMKVTSCCVRTRRRRPPPTPGAPPSSAAE